MLPYRPREAIDAVGRALFESDWTGKEIHARAKPGFEVLPTLGFNNEDQGTPQFTKSKYRARVHEMIDRLAHQEQWSKAELKAKRQEVDRHLDELFAGDKREGAEKTARERFEIARERLRVLIQHSEGDTVYIDHPRGKREFLPPSEWEAYDGGFRVNYQTGWGGFERNSSGEVWINRGWLDLQLGLTTEQRRKGGQAKKFDPVIQEFINGLVRQGVPVSESKLREWLHKNVDETIGYDVGDLGLIRFISGKDDSLESIDNDERRRFVRLSSLRPYRDRAKKVLDR